MKAKTYINRAEKIGYKVARVKKVGTLYDGSPIFKVITPSVSHKRYKPTTEVDDRSRFVDLTYVDMGYKKHHLIPYKTSVTLNRGQIISKDQNFSLVL